MKNKKSQFYILTAIIVVSSVLIINYAILSYKETSSQVSNIPFSDVPYLSRSINRSFQETMDYSIPTSARDGDLETILENINDAYFNSYSIGENELNFGISDLDVPVSSLNIDNIDLHQNFLVIGPDNSILGLRNIEKTRIYENTMDIGIIKTLYEEYTSASKEFKVGEAGNMQTIHIGKNFISGGRILIQDKRYEITEVKKIVAREGEGILKFEKTYKVIFSAGSLNIETIGSKSIGDIFVLEDYHCVVQDIHYTNDSIDNDYAYIVIINRVESVSEREARSEIFAPSTLKGLNYGNILLNVNEKNYVPYDVLNVGDTVLITICIHNDYTYDIDDSDLDNSKILGLKTQIYRILKVYLSGGVGEFNIEKNKVQVLIAQEDGEWYLRVDHDGNGVIDDIGDDAIKYKEGDEFYLRGYNLLVHDIIGAGTQSVEFYLESLDKHVEVLEGNTGKLWLRDLAYDVTNNGGSITINGTDYSQGDSFVLNNFLCIVKDISSSWVKFIIKDEFQEYKYNGTEKYRIFNGWRTQEKWSYNYIWKYSYSEDANGTSQLTVKDGENLPNSVINPSPITKNSTARSIQGILLGVTDLEPSGHKEIDIYYFRDKAHMEGNNERYYLGGYPVAFRFFVTTTSEQYSQRRVAILLDNDLDGMYETILEGPDELITLDGTEHGTFKEGRIFFINGVGYRVEGIFIYHDDGDDVVDTGEEWMVVVDRVPAYQFAPILKRADREAIEPFTFILTNWEFKPNIVGKYLIEVTYTFQEKRRVTEYTYFEVR